MIGGERADDHPGQASVPEAQRIGINWDEEAVGRYSGLMTSDAVGLRGRTARIKLR